jgi:large subunit ribosomal protein L18Ae
MYKEFRDTTLNGAVAQLYTEMSGRHRAPHESIQIIKTSIIPRNEVIREKSKVFNKTSIKFPRVKPIKRAPSKSLRSTFKAKRPLLI